jgi:hypothetical protein
VFAGVISFAGGDSDGDEVVPVSSIFITPVGSASFRRLVIVSPAPLPKKTHPTHNNKHKPTPITSRAATPDRLAADGGEAGLENGAGDDTEAFDGLDDDGWMAGDTLRLTCSATAIPECMGRATFPGDIGTED